MGVFVGDSETENIFFEKSKPSNSVLREVIRLLALVDTKSQQAKLNETSISDNNGGRIML